MLEQHSWFEWRRSADYLLMMLRMLNVTSVLAVPSWSENGRGMPAGRHAVLGFKTGTFPQSDSDHQVVNIPHSRNGYFISQPKIFKAYKIIRANLFWPLIDIFIYSQLQCLLLSVNFWFLFQFLFRGRVFCVN